MYPRLALDIGWGPLVRAAARCAWPGGSAQATLPADLAAEAVVTLSVRSAVDLLLSALDLPPRSEVLLSEVTVPHIPRIIEHHGLVPVAVPVDPRTLGVDVAEVAARATPRTRMLLVAPLFGTQMPLEELARWAQQQQVRLVVDAAQAVTALPRRPAGADVSLYSFGPIKTATALGGGLALVADAELRHRMQQIQDQWPRQSRRAYFARTAKIAALKQLSQPWCFTPLVWLAERLGRDADAMIGHSARGFPDERLFARLRHRPAVPLVATLADRVGSIHGAAIADRTRRGRHLAEAIAPAAFAAGCDNPTHTYWVFPAVCREPQAVVAALRSAGFDASQISGLVVVGNPPPDHWFHRTVFIPHGRQVPERKLERIAAVVRDCG